MSILYLSIELLLDVLAFLLGVAVVIKADDNNQRFYWGIIAMCVASLMIWENVGWLMDVTDAPEYLFSEVLNLEKMSKYFVAASLIALFPIASMRPGYLNNKRLSFFLIPPTVVTTMIISFYLFNGETTKLYSIKDILTNIGQRDVMFRLFVFIVSIFSPMISLFIPFIFHNDNRRPNRNMLIFGSFLIMFVLIFVCFTLAINEWGFNMFGIAAITFVTTFSYMFLNRENPFSDYISDSCNINEEKEKTCVRGNDDMVLSIEHFFDCEHDYKDSKFSLNDLALSLNFNEREISRSLREAGFTGFHEYLNHKKLDRFRLLAYDNPDMTVKELMYSCGFTSRSTFYRLYGDAYDETPTEFIERQKTKPFPPQRHNTEF